MAMEDVGVLAHLLKHHCCAAGTQAFDPSDANLSAATKAYEAMRIPRTHRILGSSHTLGKTQQRRADSWWYNLRRELEIKRQVSLYGTLPIMKPGAAYDFAADVKRQIEETEDEACEEAREGAASVAPVAPDQPGLVGPALAGLAVATAAVALLVVVRHR